MWTYERSMDYYLITSLFFCQPLFKEQKQNSSGFFAVRHKRKQLTNRLPRCIITKHLRECWNGRQARLRCVWLRRVGSSPISRTIIEPTVDTIISCRFVIFMRKTAVISRLFHLQMHPLSNIPSKQKNRCYRWNFV